MELNEDIYQWLVRDKFIPQNSGQKLLKHSESQYNKFDIQQETKSQYLLNQDITQQFQFGLQFKKILQKLFDHQNQLQNQKQQVQQQQGNNKKIKKEQLPLQTLQNLKSIYAPTAKIYNWNQLIDAFKRVNVTFNSKIKQQILEGNNEKIHDLLKEIYVSFGNQCNEYEIKEFKEDKQTLYAQSTDLARLNLKKPLNQAKNCLEMFLLMFCRNFNLSPKQAAGLFTNNNQYLNQVLTKGLKGDFNPVIVVYQELYANINHLIDLFESDKTNKSIQFTLDALKPGLVSKNLDICQWAFRFYSKVAYEMDDKQMLNLTWEWFSDEQQGGLKSFLLGLQRHPDVKELFVTNLNMFGKYNYELIFKDTLKNCLQEDHKQLIKFYMHILEPLSEDIFSQEQIKQTQVLQIIVDYALTKTNISIENLDLDLVLLSIKLVISLWETFTEKFTSLDYICKDTISQLYNFSNQSEYKILKYNSLNYQFNLLEKMGEIQNSWAPIIYQQLTKISLVQIQNQQIREYMTRNLQQIFTKLHTIPIQIFLEPYITQIQQLDQNFDINTFDITFFFFLSRHERLQVGQAIQMLDLLFKYYLNSVIWSQSVIGPIENILQRFISDQVVQHFIQKFVKVALAIYFASEKNKIPKEKVLPLYNNKNANPDQVNYTPGQVNQSIIQSQIRGQIVELLKQIIGYQEQSLNDKIKQLVTHTNFQLKQLQQNKKDNKGMVSVLKLLSQDYKEVLNQYNAEKQQEMNQHETNKEDQNNPQYQIDQSLQHHKDHNLSYILGLSELKKRPQKQKQQTKEESFIAAVNKRNQLQADPKILDQIKQIKEKKENQKVNETIIQENNQKKQEKQQKQLRNLLEKRSILQGVSNLNKQDQQAELIFEIDTVEKMIEKDNNKNNNQLPQIDFFDIKLEEFRDQQMVDILQKKYHKLFRFLFNKYANSGYTSKNLNNFDQIKDRVLEINQAEIWKFIREFQLDKHISQQENKQLIKITQQQGLNQKNITYSLDFNGFQIYIIQLSSFIFCQEKNEQNNRHLPISVSIKQLIDQMKKVTQDKNQNTNLFDDPDLNYFGEKQIIKVYNQYLSENPSYPLPDGYKKVVEKDIQFTYEINQKKLGFQIKESQKIAYDIVQDILQNCLQIPITEPFSTVKKTVKAVPKFTLMDNKNLQPQYLSHFEKPQNKIYLDELQKIQEKEQEKQNYKIGQKTNITQLPVSQSSKFRYQNPHRQIRSVSHNLPSKSTQNIQNQGQNNIKNNQIFSQFEPANKYFKHKPLIPSKKKNLSLALKLGISTFGLKDKYSAEQVAYLLDDMIDAVEKGKQSVKEEKHQNPIIKQRQVLQKKQEEQEKEYKKILQIRKQKLKEQIEKDKELKKQNEERLKQKESEQLQKQKEQQLKINQQKKQQQEQQKAQIEEYRKEKLKKKEEEKQKKIEEENQKKKQGSQISKDLQKKQENKIQQLIEQRKEKQKMQEEEKKQKEEKLKNFQIKNQQKIQENMKMVKEITQQNNEKIDNLFKSSQVQRVFSNNNSELQVLYQFLQKQTFQNLKRQLQVLPLKTIFWFSNAFKISPEVISIKDIKFAYRSAISKNKSGNSQGLNYQEFLEFLTRIAIKGLDIFNKLQKNIEIMDQEEQQDQKENQKLKLKMTQQEQEKLIQTKFDQNRDQNQDSNINDENDQENNNNEDEEKLQENNQKQNKNTNENIKNNSNNNNHNDITLVDDYGDIEQANSDTVNCLIYYLTLPKDKASMVNRLKYVIKESKIHIPDKTRKEQLSEKLCEDPREYINQFKVKKQSGQVNKSNANISQINQSNMLNDLSQLQDLNNNSGEAKLKEEFLKQINEQDQNEENTLAQDNKLRSENQEENQNEKSQAYLSNSKIQNQISQKQQQENLESSQLKQNQNNQENSQIKEKQKNENEIPDKNQNENQSLYQKQNQDENGELNNDSQNEILKNDNDDNNNKSKEQPEMQNIQNNSNEKNNNVIQSQNNNVENIQQEDIIKENEKMEKQQQHENSLNEGEINIENNTNEKLNNVIQSQNDNVENIKQEDNIEKSKKLQKQQNENSLNEENINE